MTKSLSRELNRLPELWTPPELLAAEEIEEVVEDGDVLQRKAGAIRFLACDQTLWSNGACAEPAESETTKSDAKCRNKPNDRRYEDQKAFGRVSILESKWHPRLQWIPLQEIQEPAVSEEHNGNAAEVLDEGTRLGCRPL